MKLQGKDTLAIVISDIETFDSSVSEMRTKLNNYTDGKESIAPGVFVLKLEGNRYFIGYTTKSLLERINNENADWVMKHPPEAVVEVKMTAPNKEHIKDVARATTLQYMRAYGFKNVRGYAWTSVNMKTMPEPLKGETVPMNQLNNETKVKKGDLRGLTGVFALRLQGDKFCIGKAKDIYQRIDHYYTKGTANEHPLSIHGVYTDKAKADVKREYLDQYGENAIIA